jgi:hypothetical protein
MSNKRYTFVRWEGDFLRSGLLFDQCGINLWWTTDCLLIEQPNVDDTRIIRLGEWLIYDEDKRVFNGGKYLTKHREQ